MAVTAYNQVLVGNIDITETYKSLMIASTGDGSAYLRAKETLNDSLGSMSGLSDNEKAKIIAETISSIAKEVTNSAMQMALKIDTENRDAKYALTKLKEDTRRVTAEIAKTEKDIEMADKQLLVATVSGWKVQAEAYRDFGVKTWDQLETVTILPKAAYDDYGTKVETLKKAKVDTYATYSNSFRQNGKVTYTNNTDGSFNTVSGTDDGLTYFQSKVAKRQEKGFDDNMRQHVVNASASMISMLLSTEASGIDYKPYQNAWGAAAGYLGNYTYTPVV